jgi:hypothetical protein
VAPRCWSGGANVLRSSGFVLASNFHWLSVEDFSKGGWIFIKNVCKITNSLIYPKRLFLEATPLFSALLIVVGFALILFARRPVVAVTDEYFSAIYGKEREKAAALECSIVTMRRVITFNAPADADDETLASLLISYRRPFCVVFPFRYAQTAKLYAQKAGAAAVFVLEERNLAPPPLEGVCYVASAWREDFYRALFIAAVLAKNLKKTPSASGGEANEKNEGADEKDGRVIVLSQETLNDEAGKAVKAGLKAGGIEGGALVVSSVSNYMLKEAESAVLVSSISSFVQLAEDLPALAFTAAPADFLPFYVKAALDDSIWALLPAVVKGAKDWSKDLGSGGPGSGTDGGNARQTNAQASASIKIFLNRGIPPLVFLKLLSICAKKDVKI